MHLILLETGHFVDLHTHKSVQVKKHQAEVKRLPKIMKRMKMNWENGFMWEQGLDLL